MNTSIDCERARKALMASLDGESDPHATADRQHLSACSACQHWAEGLTSMTGQLQGLVYPSVREDLWIAVESRIRTFDRRLTLPSRLWPIGALVIGWRVLQLFVDLPIPILHPLVPLAATLAALWLVGGDPLAIETSAPELARRSLRPASMSGPSPR